MTSEKYAQQIDEMQRKLQQLQPALINRMGQILLHDDAQKHVSQPTLQKLNALGYDILPHPPYSPGLLPSYYHSSSNSTTFCRENTFTTSRSQEMLSKRHRILKNKQKLSSVGKNVLTVMVPILMNKDVYEPS